MCIRDSLYEVDTGNERLALRSIDIFMNGHTRNIPDNEAEINAENNYMWPEAVEVATAHKAHIMRCV